MELILQDNHKLPYSGHSRYLQHFLVNWSSSVLQCVWPLPLFLCTGVAEVKLKLFTVLENSVASDGVTSYYVMCRDVSVSRGCAMAEAISCWPVTAECQVESRGSQCETSEL